MRPKGIAARKLVDEAIEERDQDIQELVQGGIYDGADDGMMDPGEAASAIRLESRAVDPLFVGCKVR